MVNNENMLSKLTMCRFVSFCRRQRVLSKVLSRCGAKKSDAFADSDVSEQMCRAFLALLTGSADNANFAVKMERNIITKCASACVRAFSRACVRLCNPNRFVKQIEIGYLASVMLVGEKCSDFYALPGFNKNTSLWL